MGCLSNTNEYSLTFLDFCNNYPLWLDFLVHLNKKMNQTHLFQSCHNYYKHLQLCQNSQNNINHFVRIDDMFWIVMFRFPLMSLFGFFTLSFLSSHIWSILCCLIEFMSDNFAFLFKLLFDMVLRVLCSRILLPPLLI